MFGLSRAKSSVVYGVLYDINSESVGVAIVESNKSEKFPVVIFSHRVPLRIKTSTTTMKERLRSMREALFSASLIVSLDGIKALAEHNKRARVSEILLTVAAPWSITLSRKVEYKGDKELKITRSLLDDLVASAESEISEELGKQDYDKTLSFQIVERATVDVEVNEYLVETPLGLHGKDVSLVHVTGIIPTDVIAAVREVEEKVFPDTSIHSHTFLLVLYCVIRDIFPKEKSLTLIHVTGESTEFGIVEDSTLIESISIPYGLNTIVSMLAEKAGRDTREVYSELTLYHEKGLTDTRIKEMDAVFEEYKTLIEEKLEEHASVRRFPKAALVLAPHSFTDLFKDILTPVVKEQFGVTREMLTLESDVLSKTAEGEDDANVTINSRFFHKLHGCGEVAL